MSLRRSSALRDAVYEWEREGLISAEAASTISARYELDHDAVWYKNTSFMIGVVASILVSAGLILLISENWHHLSVPVRMLTGIIPWLATAILTIRATNHQPPTTDHQPRTAEAWGFLTSLLFGVNIFLQAQIFHLGGYWPTAIMWWAAGSLAMGAVLRSPSIIALSQVLALIWIDNETSYQHFTPTVLVGVALIAAASMQRLTRLTATGLIALLCWALFHTWRGMILSEPRIAIKATNFEEFMILVALGGLAIALFTWAEPISRSFRNRMIKVISAVVLLMALIASASKAANNVWLEHGDWFTSVLALLGCALLLIGKRDTFSYGVCAVILMLTIGSHATVDPWLPSAVTTLNLILFGTAIAFLWSGIKHARKAEFMTGLIVVIALAFARFLDYFEDYMLGALVFMSAGVLLFLANLFWNRRYAKD